MEINLIKLLISFVEYLPEFRLIKTRTFGSWTEITVKNTNDKENRQILLFCLIPNMGISL